jgi:DNA-binding transcriptional LysR family regulator
LGGSDPLFLTLPRQHPQLSRETGRRCTPHADGENRRIIDRAFAVANAHPSPRLETNSIMNLLASVKSMGLASIMPEYFIDVLGKLEGVRAIPLVEPSVQHAVGLVGLPREPQSPLISALFATARKLKT